LKAAFYFGKEDIRIKDVGVPVLSDGEALIKVRWAGICGSDLTIYKGRDERVRPPLIIGHEFSGEIVNIASRSSSKVKVGDRVVVEPLLPCGKCYACRMGMYHACKSLKIMGVHAPGCFAEFIKVPVSTIYKVPDELSLELAALIEPVSVAYHALRRSGLQVGDSIAVLGGGPIGLFIAEIAREGGASLVIVSEINLYRLNFAEKMGFHVIRADKVNVEEEVKKLTQERGVDIVFDAAGVPATASQLVSLCKIGGRAVVVGIHRGVEGWIDLKNLCYKEITLFGSRNYHYPDFEKGIELIRNNKTRFGSFITNKIDLEDLAEEIRKLEKGEGVKSLVKL